MVTAARQTSISERFARKFLRLASLAEARGEHLLARQRYLQAVSHDPTPAAGLALGWFLCERRLFDDARLVLHDAWNLARRRENHPEIAECCRSLAMASRRQNDHSDARRWTTRAADAEMQSWTSADDSWSPAQLQLESLLALDEQDRPRAQKLAVASHQLSNHPSDVIASCRHLARIETRLGRNHAAARHLLSAARVACDLADHRRYADCMFELGHALRSLARLRNAAVCYRIAAETFDRARRPLDARGARARYHETRLLAHSLAGDPDCN